MCPKEGAAAVAGRGARCAGGCLLYSGCSLLSGRGTEKVLQAGGWAQPDVDNYRSLDRSLAAFTLKNDASAEWLQS